jgi:hypothetical protein
LDTQAAGKIVAEQVDAVIADPSLVKGNGCAACHVLFSLAGRMCISEADAAALLSEVLLEDIALDGRFLEMVEAIHMKQRMTGVTFAIKTRDAKDRYLDSQLKNSLEELLSDAALQIAQNLGVDYHAATEELYHYMRRHDESERDLENLTSSLLGRAKK